MSKLGYIISYLIYMVNKTQLLVSLTISFSIIFIITLLFYSLNNICIVNLINENNVIV